MQKLNRQITRLAVPNIISNISIPLLGIVDIAVLGHLESEVYIGAVALGGMLFNFIYWGFSFLRMGTGGFTAQAFGARDFRECGGILQRSLLVGVGGAVFILMLQLPIAWVAFALTDASPSVEFYAREYFLIRVWAAPATLALYALSGWFIGMQNTRFPMIITIIVNVLNLAFNLLLIYAFGMKSDGVALGTVLAQYCGLAVALFLFYRFYGRFRIRIPLKELLEKAKMKRFASVNTDIIIRTLSLVFVFSFFTAKSASENDVLLAVNTILLQFLMFFSYFIDGFAYAGEALTGKFKGAGNKTYLKKTIKVLFVWGAALSIPFSLLYLAIGNTLVELLTANPKVILLARDFTLWVAFIPLITFPAFIWDGIYIGTTASKAMRNSMLVATLTGFLPCYYLIHPIAGNHALWAAMLVFMLLRGVLLSLLAPKHILQN